MTIDDNRVLIAATIILFALSFLYFKGNLLLSKPNISKQLDANVSVLQLISAIDGQFDWKAATPLTIRPFVNKRNFNPSMAIKSIKNTPYDWLLIENTYLNNIELKKSVALDRPDDVIFMNDDPCTKLAVVETYDTIINFLISRYPMYFESVGKQIVKNTITGLKFPRYGKDIAPKSLLSILNKNIEEDFLLLLKDNPNNLDKEYKLKASINGFPAGFDPKVGHNQPISFIHSPVPQYPSRLQTSMHKFFNNLQPKDLWVRHNWSIQTNAKKFNLDSLHGREGEKITQLKSHEINFDETFLRVERQIFTRLPKSRANLMTIRTYLTPISQIKQEGLAPDLIFGIDSLPDDLAFYKRRDAWGEAIKQYLRG